MESNAFKTSEEPASGFGAVVAALVGLLAVAATFYADPLGREFFVLTWLLVLGGIAVALCPGRIRRLGAGLVFAGAAVPLAFFCWFWVLLSVGMIFR